MDRMPYSFYPVGCRGWRDVGDPDAGPCDDGWGDWTGRGDDGEPEDGDATDASE